MVLRSEIEPRDMFWKNNTLTTQPLLRLTYQSFKIVQKQHEIKDLLKLIENGGYWRGVVKRMSVDPACNVWGDEETGDWNQRFFFFTFNKLKSINFETKKYSYAEVNHWTTAML